MAEGRRGGKKHRKHGRQARRESFKRYWARQKGYANRAELHKARRIARFEYMVEESRERRASRSQSNS